MADSIAELFRVHVCPPKPILTEKNLPDQTDKVFVVTGASAGVGAQLAQILYGANASVYIAARSEANSNKVIETIKSAHPTSKGSLTFLRLDLSDLPTIKKSAETFLAASQRLDVLFLNAGVMIPPQGSVTAQGVDLQLGTNNLGHFLFVKYLHDILRKTAKTAPRNSVRIVWVSSSAADMAPNPPIDMDNVDYARKQESPSTKYFRSKAGNALHAVEFARRFSEQDGIISVALNPGNLQSDLQRHVGFIGKLFLKLMLWPAINGAYTELFAGLSQEITMENGNAGWYQPWGRQRPMRKELKDEKLGKAWWDWCEEKVNEYA